MLNNKIRNLGILAHVDAGKTTISEYMLYKSGRIRKKGRVDDGTTSTDWLPVERQRGISVKAAVTSFNWQGVKVNLIDTPGHNDFAAEVERTLWAMDCAVLVISAAEGVEAQTEILWHALQAMKIPTIIFVNKVDRKAADLSKILPEIMEKLTDDIIALQQISGEQTKNPLVKDLLEDENCQQVTSEALIEFVADRNLQFMEKYLQKGSLSTEEVKSELVSLVHNRQAYPVLYGAALQELGLAQLLDAIISYLPGPEIKSKKKTGGIVFKIENEKSMGRMCYIRLFNGQLKNRDSVYNVTQDRKEKITQIRKAFVGQYQDVGLLQAGDIGIICGFSKAQVGDILGNENLTPTRPFQLAEPLLRVKVKPQEETDYLALIEAVQLLSEEDPLLDMEWFKESREINIKIMGVIQLEVLASIFRERFALEVEFSRPSVIYRETPAGKGEGSVRYTMPKPCWAVLRFQIEPGPLGSGVDYSSQVRKDIILPKYQKQVEDTLPDALEQGLHGWQVTDLKIRLIDGEYHVEHTHPPDFTVATPMGIMDGLNNTGTLLLEPMLDFTISVPEKIGGSVLNQLVNMRATVAETEIKGKKIIITGQIPLATSMDYPIKLSSLSGGRGIMETGFSGYQKCSVAQGKTCPRRGVNPLDRAKYILSVRNAIGN